MYLNECMYVNKKRQRESHIKCSLKILNSLAFQTTLSIEASWFEPENSHPSHFGSKCAFHRCRWFWSVLSNTWTKAHTHWIIFYVTINTPISYQELNEWLVWQISSKLTLLGGGIPIFWGWDPPTKLPEVYSSKRPLPKETLCMLRRA